MQAGSLPGRQGADAQSDAEADIAWLLRPAVATVVPTATTMATATERRAGSRNALLQLNGNGYTTLPVVDGVVDWNPDWDLDWHPIFNRVSLSDSGFVNADGAMIEVDVGDGLRLEAQVPDGIEIDQLAPSPFHQIDQLVHTILGPLFGEVAEKWFIEKKILKKEPGCAEQPLHRDAEVGYFLVVPLIDGYTIKVAAGSHHHVLPSCAAVMNKHRRLEEPDAPCGPGVDNNWNLQTLTLRKGEPLLCHSSLVHCGTEHNIATATATAGATATPAASSSPGSTATQVLHVPPAPPQVAFHIYIDSNEATPETRRGERNTYYVAPSLAHWERWRDSNTEWLPKGVAMVRT